MPGHTGYYSDLSEFVNTDQILAQVELYRDQTLEYKTDAEAAATEADVSEAAAIANANAAGASASAASTSALTSAGSAIDSAASASASEASRIASGVSAVNAGASETNAAASAAAAAASAAGVSLPSAAGNALNMLRQNSGATGLEYRTPTQVRSDLSLANSATIAAATAATASTLVQRGAAGEVTSAALTATTIGGTTITASVGLVGPGSGITALNMANASSGTLAVTRGGTGTTTSSGTGSVVLTASPTLTGTPLAPTATQGTNTTQLATTAFVKTAIDIGGVPLGYGAWGSRTNPFLGHALDDGQELSRATYPEMAAALDAGLLPTVSEATWQANPSQRACFVALSSTGNFRMRDLNGKSSGSLGALFKRGDGVGSAGTPGLIQGHAIQEHTHSLTAGTTLQQYNLAGGQGGGGSFTAAAATNLAGPSNFGTSTVQVATETRPLNATGAWQTRIYGTVQNVGSANAAQLATDYATLSTRVTNLPFTKEYTSSAQTITLGGTLSLAHGLAAQPKLIKISATCLTGESGYSTGDVLEIAHWGDYGGTAAGYGLSAKSNSTTVSVKIANTAFAIVLAYGTGSGGQLLTAANWTLTVRAYA